jgi:F1F0 ATPase subunit 2
MNEFFSLAAASVAGLLLGVMFFGGLWWTVRAGVTSRRPALWFLGSLVLRMSITLAGFHLVGGEHWQALVACLLGFITARSIVNGLTQPAAASLIRDAQEASHAP